MLLKLMPYENENESDFSRLTPLVTSFNRFALFVVILGNRNLSHRLFVRT